MFLWIRAHEISVHILYSSSMSVLNVISFHCITFYNLGEFFCLVLGLVCDYCEWSCFHNIFLSLFEFCYLIILWSSTLLKVFIISKFPGGLSVVLNVYNITCKLGHFDFYFFYLYYFCFLLLYNWLYLGLESIYWIKVKRFDTFILFLNLSGNSSIIFFI